MTDDLSELVRSVLRGGLRCADAEEAREALSLSADADDARFASLLVEDIARRSTEAVRVSAAHRVDPRPRGSERAVSGGDASFLGRLRTDGGGEGELDVRSLDNPSTVLAVARAGTLRQRRAAIHRMVALLEERRMRGEDSRRLHEFLSSPRDVELAYELSEARARLGGAIGREARAEHEQLLKLSASVARDIRSVLGRATSRRTDHGAPQRRASQSAPPSEGLARPGRRPPWQPRGGSRRGPLASAAP